jgi:hypothetical protein
MVGLLFIAHYSNGGEGCLSLWQLGRLSLPLPLLKEEDKKEKRGEILRRPTDDAQAYVKNVNDTRMTKLHMMHLWR